MSTEEEREQMAQDQFQDPWLTYSHPGYGYDDDGYYDDYDAQDYYDCTDEDVAEQYSYWDAITDNIMTPKTKLRLIALKIRMAIQHIPRNIRWKLIALRNRWLNRDLDPNDIPF